MLLTDDTAIYDYDGPVCIYCGEPLPTDDCGDCYCSALCACYAERDNADDRA